MKPHGISLTGQTGGSVWNIDLRLGNSRLPSFGGDYMRMENRLSKCSLAYNAAVTDTLSPMFQQDTVNYENALRLLQKLWKI
jgi:hypothetical protein